MLDNTFILSIDMLQAVRGSIFKLLPHTESLGIVWFQGPV